MRPYRKLFLIAILGSLLSLLLMWLSQGTRIESVTEVGCIGLFAVSSILMLISGILAQRDYEHKRNLKSSKET